MEPDVSGAVLLGGSSRRMGFDKLSLQIDGIALARRSAIALLGVGVNELLAIGGDPRVLGDLDHRAIPDEVTGAGPLSAIVAALRAANHTHVLVLAGDLPDADPILLRELLRRAVAGSADVVVPVREVASGPTGAPSEHHREVLAAVYHRRCLDPFAAALAAGERSVMRALAAVVVVDVAVADGPAWRDLDTPEDVAGRGAPTAGGERCLEE